jgi:hypothetical protein
MTAPGEPLPATYGEHLMSVDSIGARRLPAGHCAARQHNSNADTTSAV